MKRMKANDLRVGMKVVSRSGGNFLIVDVRKAATWMHVRCHDGPTLRFGEDDWVWGDAAQRRSGTLDREGREARFFRTVRQLRS
jgi:hypothetical protein